MLETTHSLKQLLRAWKKVVNGTNHPQPPDYEGKDILITKVTESTAEVNDGACFVARVREGSDGHPFIGKALALGARMILAQRPANSLDLEIPDDVVYLQVPDTAVAVAWLAAAWEGFPSHDLVVIGITGTDGKSSTASILFSILQEAGLKTGLLSTIKAVIGRTEEPLALHVTTPEAPVVQQYLRRMVEAGLTHCIVESTSHGLAQHRVGAIEFDLAVVTNITHEHLDYHGSYEQYFAAKARLFESLALDPWQLAGSNAFKEAVIKTAILNIDDASFKQLAAIDVPGRLNYGLDVTADVFAIDIHSLPRGTEFSLRFNNEAFPEVVDPVNISSSLFGEFNVYNMLAAATAAAVLKVGVDSIQQGLQAVAVVSGRMEPIFLGQSFIVMVDFAHTPNALANVINAARNMGSGRIITVFGSAGKRDVQKRRLMAEISTQLADITVLTAEDPRTESLDEILDAMADGCRSLGGVETQTFWCIRDRGQAIFKALSLAERNDIVLICGKGHEQSMCFGKIEFPWDDRQATRSALNAVLNGQRMPDLGLPTFQSTG